MMPSVKSALFKVPGASGNRAFLSFALVVGLVNLSLGLLGTFLTHAHSLFWAFVVCGISDVSLGVGETLPVRLARVTVVLWLTRLLMGITFTALLFIVICIA
jgi:hypothetical protein